MTAPLALRAVGLSLAQGTPFQPAPVEPVSIPAPAPSGAMAIRGTVAQVVGSRFVVQDATGQALVGTGCGGGGLVAKGESVTVRRRFETGFPHARVLPSHSRRED